MLQEIRNQIDNINQSLAWIRKNKEEDYYQRFKFRKLIKYNVTT